MIYKILSSYITMLILLVILAVGAAFGTFIENDYGSTTAKELIYTSFWYGFVLFLTTINIILIVHKTKMYKVKARMVFHLAFVVIFIGSLLTHFFGLDGIMHIREGGKSNIIMIGDKHIETPFYINLIDFKLTRYPGSMSPSEYSSKVEVYDNIKNETFEANIFMNNTLSYGGYKFFQSSYDGDEKGTVLSVNKDPGIELTYIGYALLFLGLILNLFDKKSRYRSLLRKMKKAQIASILLPLIFMSFSTSTLLAQDESEFIDDYLKDYKVNSKDLSVAFGSLIVQAPDGRMKPLDTQNKEILNKLTGKSSWNGMDANQVVLGLFSRPEIWKKVDIIKVITPKLRKVLGVDKDQKLVSFFDFFDNDGNYKLTKEVELANLLVPAKRGTYERDLIRTDERLNIFFMTYRGVLHTIFPIPNSKNNKWADFKTMFTVSGNKSIRESTNKFLEETYNRNYDNALSYIKDIKMYQVEHGKTVIPSQKKLNTEIWYNKIFLFVKLFILYLILGFTLFVYSLISILTNKPIGRKIRIVILLLSSLLIFVHAFGIGIRWYIGGFAPITNTYETMIYIAFSSAISGVFFLRKSILALSASFMMAGIFIFAAYLGEVDPEITSLVPVLKSYWLSIHVSVITASYGFFGVGAFLGIISLLLYILRNEKRKHIDNHIVNITNINEITLILGLVLLTIGNFLGGIWANESWGRYWGWDPKETWAYISIIVYTIVLHVRLVKPIYSRFLFASLSIIAFFSILMTYYGVNFYLSGLHSYATGDPVPIPTWVYYMVGTVVLMIAFAYKKRVLTNLNN